MSKNEVSVNPSEYTSKNQRLCRDGLLLLQCLYSVENALTKVKDEAGMKRVEK